MRCSRPFTCPGVACPSDMYRQRKLSVQKVQAFPPGHTFTPRLSIICKLSPSPDSLPPAAASAFESRDGQYTNTSTPFNSIRTVFGAGATATGGAAAGLLEIGRAHV